MNKNYKIILACLTALALIAGIVLLATHHYKLAYATLVMVVLQLAIFYMNWQNQRRKNRRHYRPVSYDDKTGKASKD